MKQSSTAQFEAQLKAFHLTSMPHDYRPQAKSAAQDRWPYEAYLAGLIKQETDRRFRNRRGRRIREVHFPLLKELADFDFEVIPNLNRHRIMDLTQGTYLRQVESATPSATRD